ncbi:hypothetical protein DdX_12643 [Ditylenchus destructor]|uniref:Uncharacterized protein n=1 Tax=Ditylenchus destructor TaxID=166010 RepID=A0AAD4MXU8_9BILA|nr:hypothetical protein DdX_12643 [Ditylenchus destructor]
MYFFVFLIAAFLESVSSSLDSDNSSSVFEGVKLALRCDNNQHINSHGGKAQLSCVSPRISHWETFTVVHIAGHNVVSIKAVDSFFVNANWVESGWILLSNGVTTSPIAQFDQYTNDDATVSFKCHNNLFASRNAETNLVACTAPEIDANSKFTPVPVPE